jgi:hypothetical protein
MFDWIQYRLEKVWCVNKLVWDIQLEIDLYQIKII